MNNKISPLYIFEELDKTIFHKDKYVIPLYQRAFAWSDEEICQLIDDIKDFAIDHYYLGSLIVNLNQDNIYEVIDGQQRLTALFLLLNYVGCKWEKDRLGYECRERSNHTLNCLVEQPNESCLTNEEKIEQSIKKGRDIINDKFLTDDINIENFIAQLKKVILYRIEVPPHTDLNRYFEIMNVRGEQLEQHDILKAKLMKELDDNERNAFAIVWDACRDMTGYVQMHFLRKDRETLFGDNWDRLTLDGYDTLCKEEETNIPSHSVLYIISRKYNPTSTDDKDETGNRVRFDSIIGFTHFLLHVLKVFVAVESYTVELDNGSYSIFKMLDDKEMLDFFSKVIDTGKQNGNPIDKKDFSRGFIKCLLKCRFLFDKYIIKREYKNEDLNGDWSLKELKVSGSRSTKKPYYKDTYFGEKNEREKTYSPRTKINLMLQSCLRVSFTSPKNMHWITKLLLWLYENSNREKLSQFQVFTEKITKESVISFLQDKTNFCKGVNTPHIVFNYLDYLLWTKRNNKNDLNDLLDPERSNKNDNKGLDFDQFAFEFRNSVEHWYPQHPSENSFDGWSGVDQFGNLCVIQRNINSKFSNLSPTAKTSTYGKMIEKGSLKLRLMSKLTTDDAEWKSEEKDGLCAKHGEQMLNLLRRACKLPIIP